MEKNAKVLVIAPHPDDEAFGCGGTLNKLTNHGAEIYMAVGSCGSTIHESNVREAEMKEAMHIIGIRDTTTFIYLGDAQLNTVPTRELVTKIDTILSIRHFNYVFLPCPSHHEDHQIMQRATIAALRPGARSYTPENILMYEYTYSSWSSNDTPYGKYYMPLGNGNMNAKTEAIRAYVSQLRGFPHPVSVEAAEHLARTRGMAIGVPYAEMFYVVQMIGHTHV